MGRKPSGLLVPDHASFLDFRNNTLHPPATPRTANFSCLFEERQEVNPRMRTDGKGDFHILLRGLRGPLFALQTPEIRQKDVQLSIHTCDLGCDERRSANVSNLKAKLLEKIQAHRPRTTKLVKEQGVWKIDADNWR